MHSGQVSRFFYNNLSTISTYFRIQVKGRLKLNELAEYQNALWLNQRSWTIISVSWLMQRDTFLIDLVRGFRGIFKIWLFVVYTPLKMWFHIFLSLLSSKYYMVMKSDPWMIQLSCAFHIRLAIASDRSVSKLKFHQSLFVDLSNSVRPTHVACITLNSTIYINVGLINSIFYKPVWR